MIKEQKKWMCYTYFHRSPSFRWRTTYLFSPVRKKIPGMICVSYPTMIADIRESDVVRDWSESTRTKINKAAKDPLSVQRDSEVLPEVLNLFSQTAQKKKLRGHFPKDFNSRPWILCSAVYLEDLILAGHVWVIDEEEKRALLFVNASRHQDKNVDAALVGRAHYYLLWKDGMYLRHNGIDCLDLHGYQPD